MEFPRPPPPARPCPRFPVANVMISRPVEPFLGFRQARRSKQSIVERFYFLPRFLHRNRFSNASKKRDVACNWQDLSSVKFNRDPGFVVNFSKQKHTHPLLKVYCYMICSGDYIWGEFWCDFLPSIKVLFIALKHNLRKREATSKFKNPLVLKVQFETGRPPCCSYCVEVEVSWRGSNESSTV